MNPNIFGRLEIKWGKDRRAWEKKIPDLWWPGQLYLSLPHISKHRRNSVLQHTVKWTSFISRFLFTVCFVDTADLNLSEMKGATTPFLMVVRIKLSLYKVCWGKVYQIRYVIFHLLRKLVSPIKLYTDIYTRQQGAKGKETKLFCSFYILKYK